MEALAVIGSISLVIITLMIIAWIMWVTDNVKHNNFKFKFYDEEYRRFDTAKRELDRRISNIELCKTKKDR